MANKNKASFKGHCQLCDRLQMLPGGKMAKHGYTVANRGNWGFFNGTCAGSDELPYEQSAALLPPMIAEQTRVIANLEKWREEVLSPVVEQKCWVHEYVRGSYHRSGYYRWRYVDVIATPRTSQDGSYSWIIFTYKSEDGKTEEHFSAGSDTGKDVVTFCAKMNAKKADDISRNIKNHNEYKVWLEKRLANFKVTDLIPRKEGE